MCGPGCVPCKKCGKLFAQFASALKHCKLKKKKSQSTLCPVCNKTIKLKRNLKRHMIDVHEQPRPKQPVEVITQRCESCGVDFSSKHKFKEHNRRKHGHSKPAETGIECSICNKTYSVRKFKAHMTLIHTDGEQFKCESCPASYKSMGGLYNHRRRFHRDSVSAQQINHREGQQSPHHPTAEKQHSSSRLDDNDLVEVSLAGPLEQAFLTENSVHGFIDVRTYVNEVAEPLNLVIHSTRMD